MEIPIYQALNIIQSEIEELIYKKMEESQLSAGLMEKILESTLCQIRKLKCQDLEKFIIEINREIPEICDEKVEAHTIKGVEKNERL